MLLLDNENGGCQSCEKFVVSRSIRFLITSEGQKVAKSSDRVAKLATLDGSLAELLSGVMTFDVSELVYVVFNSHHIGLFFPYDSMTLIFLTNKIPQIVFYLSFEVNI